MAKYYTKDSFFNRPFNSPFFKKPFFTTIRTKVLMIQYRWNITFSQKHKQITVLKENEMISRNKTILIRIKLTIDWNNLEKFKRWG